jgi:two-component system phosphate regulon sensor histidine kinase PhoR
LKLGIRGKLFVISLALIGLMAVTSGVLVETVMRGILVARLDDELTRLSGVCREALELAPEPLAVGSHQKLVRELGSAAKTRVSVISADGRVLADSALSDAELVQAENHAHRPEVRGALAEGRGVSSRYSTTIQHRMMYLAVRYQRSDGTGVVRVAMSLADVEALIGHMRWLHTGAVLFGLLVAAGMGILASHFASRSLMDLVARARTVASGERGQRISLGSDDELSGLAGSFNRMAEELDRTVSTLGDERDRSQAILESLSDAVMAIDASLVVASMNSAALKLLGLARAPHGSRLIDVVRLPQLLEIVSRAADGETAHAELVWHGPPRRMLLATATPQRARGQCVLVLRDVTELRKLESMRRDFVANVSHELRTPVSIISANVETLVSGALKDPVRAQEFLGAVQRNAERLARLVNDLLDLARIEEGRYEASLVPLTVEEPISAVFDLLETRAQDRGLSLHVDVEDELRFVGDERSIEQVLVNLVDNAIKYTPRGGKIGIDVRQHGEHVLFEVWDTGPGVPEAHRARLFERFYRVDPGRSRDMGGTGLGLSIVKHLVESMRGDVGMRPREGGGSVFYVSLPAAQRVARRDSVPSEPGDPPGPAVDAPKA